MDLLLLFLSLVLFLIFFFHNHHHSKNQPQPLLKPYPILGTLPHLLKNTHRFVQWTTDILTHPHTPTHTHTHTLTLLSPTTINGVVTSDPRNVEHILKTNFPNFTRGQRSLAFLRDFLGHGIFNSEGDHWHRQRKTASYEFSKRSLRNFVMHTVRLETVDRLIPLLTATAEKGDTTVDLQDVLERFGFDSICKVAFGEDPGCLCSQGGNNNIDVMNAFGDAQRLILARFFDGVGFMWRIKKMLNVGTERRLKEAIGVVHGYAMEIIKKRKEMMEEGDDLLSRFASDENYSEELLRDNVISFMVAGRDTTSSALTWFFWLLSSHPDVEQKILEEIRSIRAARQSSDDETITITTFSFDELREMHYLHAAISESLRLYPPVAIDTQSCKDGDVLPDGTFVGKGWFVSYSAYAMGRTESIWGEDCKVYRPERWLENGVFRPESPFRFPVFHAGPRMCLGKEMAYIQMKSIAASVVEKFEVRAAEESKNAEPLLSLTLRMKGGLHVRVRERVQEY